MSSPSTNDAETLFDTVVRDSLQLSQGVRLTDLAYGVTPEWDSVAHLMLIAALEEAFEVRIDPEDVLRTSSYAQLRGLLRERHGIALSA